MIEMDVHLTRDGELAGVARGHGQGCTAEFM